MADYQYLTETGVIVPDTANLLAEVQDEFKTAFGPDLDTSAETPQGVLITGETLARQKVVKNNADVANQINPNLAGGVFLDALWTLTGGRRVKATPSTLRNVALTGVPGAIVLEGAQASVGAAGEIFQLLSAVILDNTGSGVGTFQSVELGPISCAIDALDTIVTPVLGWETVSNPAIAEAGTAEESDIAARIRRRQTLALQGVALPEAIISGLHDTAGVKSLAFRENITAATIVIEGVSLVEHSIYVCVDGGTDDDVALMILRKKSLGANWNGSTAITVTDPYSGQPYTVKFDRPAIIQIYAQVTIKNPNGYPDPITAVQNAIINYANGAQNGEDGFIVGGDVSAFELSAAINREAPGIYVKNLLISNDGTTYSTADIPININQKALITASNISVTVVS